jgi:uncharacterized membrane protein
VIPLSILLISFAVLRAIGWFGIHALDSFDFPLRIALCLMFLVTASAHWGKGRADLIRMVPLAFPNAPALVSITGYLEILGAIGLLLPATARLAASCLALLLVALFPANVRAAREHLRILGRPVPGLAVRTVMQLIFITALVAVGTHGFRHG